MAKYWRNLSSFGLALALTVFLPTGASAELWSAEAAVENVYVGSESSVQPGASYNSGLLLAASKRPPSKQRRPAARAAKGGRPASAARPSAAGKRASGGGKSTNPMALKLSIGTAVGLENAKETILVYGGDFVMPWSGNINLQLGANFWMYDVEEELFASRLLLVTPGAGAGYIVPIDKTMWLEAMGRLIYGIATSTVTIINEAGAEETTVAKENFAGVALGGGFHYDIGGIDFAPEVWYPIYADSKAKNVSAINVQLAIQVHL